MDNINCFYTEQFAERPGYDGPEDLPESLTQHLNVKNTPEYISSNHPGYRNMNGTMRHAHIGESVISHGLCTAVNDDSFKPYLIPEVKLTIGERAIDLESLIKNKASQILTVREGIQRDEITVQDRNIVFLQPKQMPYEQNIKKTASTRINQETGDIEIILHGLNDKFDILGLVHEAAHAIAILSSGYHNPATYLETSEAQELFVQLGGEESRKQEIDKVYEELAAKRRENARERSEKEIAEDVWSDPALQVFIDYRIRAEVDAWFITHELLTELGLLDEIFEDGEEGFNEFVLNRLASELPTNPLNFREVKSTPRASERQYGLVTDSGFFIDYLNMTDEETNWILGQAKHENLDCAMGFSYQELEGLKDKRVLEVGPGRGSAFNQLLKLGVDIYALEPQLESVGGEWAEIIEDAKDLSRVYAQPIQNIAQVFPHDEDSFDVIFAQGINFQRYANNEEEIKTGISLAVNKLSQNGFMTFEVESDGTVLFNEGQVFELEDWLDQNGYTYEIVLGYSNVTMNPNASFIRIYNPKT